MATNSQSMDATSMTDAQTDTTDTLWADESGIGVLGIILIVIIVLILFGFIGFSIR